MDDILKSIDKSIEGLLRRVTKLETQDPIYSPIRQAALLAHIPLTNVLQDLFGASLDLDPGNYVIIGTFYVGGDDPGETFEGRLLVGTTLQPIYAICGLGLDEINTITQIWLIQLTGITTVKLQGRKTGGFGVSFIYSTYTTITALETK